MTISAILLLIVIYVIHIEIKIATAVKLLNINDIPLAYKEAALAINAMQSGFYTGDWGPLWLSVPWKGTEVRSNLTHYL